MAAIRPKNTKRSKLADDFAPECAVAAGSTKADADKPRRARQVRLPLTPRAAGLARREVRDALTSWGLERLEDTAVLLASELVGNVVQHARHGGSTLEMRIADTGAWLRIEVVDADPHLPELHLPAELDESGFGLVLVEALASKWGVDQAAVGKTVWIELNSRRAGDLDHPSSRNPATAHPDGGEQRQPQPSGHSVDEVTVPSRGDAQQDEEIVGSRLWTPHQCAAALPR